jgi:hypothetical protein
MVKKTLLNGEWVTYDRSILTEEQWEQIYNYFIIGTPFNKIAKEFNVSNHLITQSYYEFLNLKKSKKVPVNIESLQEHLVTKTVTIMGHKTTPYYKTEEEQLYYLEPKYTWESLSKQEQMFYLKYKPEV